ncbi:unnamed protein product [Sympodiomycopsis kandeliae]
MDTDSSSYTLPHCPLSTSSDFTSPSAINSLTFPSNPNTPPPYVTHLQSISSKTLLAITSDGQVSLFDKHTLTRLDSIQSSKQGHFTNVSSLNNSGVIDQGTIWGVTDRSGQCSVFDARTSTRHGMDQKMIIDTPTSSPLLSLAFSSSSSSPLLALGHELQSIDAPIYIYDLRQPSAPVVTYSESHSDDVTFLQWRSQHTPTEGDLLLSGSTDGLMTVYDLSKGSDEDEAVVSVAYTGSSLAKGGWGGASSDRSVQKGMPKPISENQLPAEYIGIGSIWAVSDMQTVGIWDAESTDPLLPPLSTQPPTTLLPSPWTRKWETDYIIDTHSMPSSSGGLEVFTGDQSGSFSLISLPNPPPFNPNSFDLDTRVKEITTTQQWTLTSYFPSIIDSAQGGHSDIVRCIDVDYTNQVMWTGGEDGKIVTWNLKADQEATPGLAMPPNTHMFDDNFSNGYSPSSSRRAGGHSAGNRFKPYG